MKIKKISFLFFFWALFFVSAGEINSQEPIEVSPFRIEEIVEPGQRVTNFINITNASDKPKTFYVFVKDFIAKGERGEVTLIPAGSQEGPFLSGWLEIPSQGISFAPREKKEIPVNFKVPENAGPGGYYGAVVFGPKAPEIKPGEGSVIVSTYQVGVLVLFRVKGDADEEARVREFVTDKNIYNVPFSVNFMTRVENLGNVHIKPIGSITIENMRGTQVAALSVNNSGANALPDSIRRFDNKWEGDFGFGKYTAYLVLSFGSLTHDGGAGIRTIMAQKTFWIMPWDIIVTMGIILLLTIIVAIFVAKWYKDKAIREAFREAGLRGKMSYFNRNKNINLKQSNEKEKKQYPFSKKVFYYVLIFIVIVVFIFLTGGLIFFLFFA